MTLLYDIIGKTGFIHQAFANNSMNSTWTGPQVAQIVGISYDTLDYWGKQGLVKASVQASKTHHRSYYTFSDIVTISAIKALRDSGISLQKIRLASDELWKRIGIKFEQGLRGGVIVADHDQLLAVLYTLDEAIQIMSLLRGGQMLLPLDDIVSKIEQRVNSAFGGTLLEDQKMLSEKELYGR